MTLTVTLSCDGLPEERVPVASIEEASRKLTAWQDAHGFGASDMRVGHGAVHRAGLHIGGISYNGKFWPP